MKKIIRLTESDLTRIVRRVINEEMNTSSFTKNSKLRIPIKKNNTFIVINIRTLLNYPEKQITILLWLEVLSVIWKMVIVIF